MTPSRWLIVLISACAGIPPAPAPGTTPPPRTFRVEVTGSGPAIVLIPGLASSGETWRTTVEHLRARHTCHVLTLAGFAGVPPIRDPLLPTVKAELAGYIARLGRPVIVGHSLGGALALDLAADHPALVGPLVIVDQLPFFGAVFGASTLGETAQMVERIRAGMAAQTPEQYEAHVRAGRATRAMVASQADHERVVGWSLASDRATVEGAVLHLAGTDLRPVLSRIATPVLVIGTWIGWREQVGGSIERADVERSFRDQYVTLRGVRFAMAETARHFVMLDDLPWFLDQLDAFLSDLADAVRAPGAAPV